jgi:hypothetical protein
MDKIVKPLDFTGTEIIVGIEAGDFAGYACLHVTGIERSHRIDATAAIANGIPSGIDGTAHG